MSTPDPNSPPQPTPPAPAPASVPQPPAPAPLPPAATAEQPLGEPGLRALQAERDARSEAERKAREAEEALAVLRQSQETDTDRLRREAEEGKRAKAEAETATARATGFLRRANTLVALTGLGIAGPKAEAAIKLVDGVEYDADGFPTNLQARVDAAKARYGAEVFGGATPPQLQPPNGRPQPQPHPSDLHQGVHGDPLDPNEDQLFEAAFARAFPGSAEAAPQT